MTIRQHIQRNGVTALLFGVCLLVQILYPFFVPSKLLSSAFSSKIAAMAASKSGYEVFGFAPYWNFAKLAGTDFNALTTLAYFDIPVSGTGDLNTIDTGYTSFWSDQATALFEKAHRSGTRVVLTVTQMNDYDITSLLNDQNAQQNAVTQIVDIVKKRGIDGVNVDFESVNDLGPYYRSAFSNFIEQLTTTMHTEIPNSQVSVSVLASSVKQPKLYDIASLSQNSDEIFMMAYDFATTSADNAMPTDPLYGYKQGQYWYDVSTAVSDFLTQMPADKLVLGLPWYGYNYPVYQPQVKAQTLTSYYASSMSQPYEIASDTSSESTAGSVSYIKGWDSVGQTSWKAYYDSYSGTWRMVFYDDPKAMAIRYDFVKKMHLAGTGIWALGFDDGKQDLWKVIEDKFGIKLADATVMNKIISTNL